MNRALPWLLMMTVALSSCGALGLGNRKAPSKPPGPFGPSGIPPELRAKGPGGDDAGTPVVAGGNAHETAAMLDSTKEEDIVYTDPNNPEAVLPELSDILGAAPKKRGPWEESETIAKQRAAREGKPLLIWFTDSQSSPMCKALDQELFSSNDFAVWANEKIIRLRVDANIAGSEFVNDRNISLGEKDSRRADARAYVTKLKKRYKVLGQPTLLMLNPSGEVIGRYRGYKRGQADFTWGLIKQGEAVSANAYNEWRASLEKRGYREWHDRRERKVFAKLTAYSKGTLILIEPDGTRCRTHEDKLSDKDRQWIADQKKLRNL